jgi:hypothetical protein
MKQHRSRTAPRNDDNDDTLKRNFLLWQGKIIYSVDCKIAKLRRSREATKVVCESVREHELDERRERENSRTMSSERVTKNAFHQSF